MKKTFHEGNPCLKGRTESRDGTYYVAVLLCQDRYTC